MTVPLSNGMIIQCLGVTLSFLGYKDFAVLHINLEIQVRRKTAKSFCFKHFMTLHLGTEE